LARGPTGFQVPWAKVASAAELTAALSLMGRRLANEQVIFSMPNAMRRRSVSMRK
jgi:hypothetical protein